VTRLPSASIEIVAALLNKYARKGTSTHAAARSTYGGALPWRAAMTTPVDVPGRQSAPQTAVRRDCDGALRNDGRSSVVIKELLDDRAQL
jgi:hypothetical protein